MAPLLLIARVVRTGLLALLFLAACGWSNDPFEKTERDDRPPPRARENVAPPDPPLEGQCENGSLSYGPVTLPPAVLGVPYEVRIGDYAERDWYGTLYYGSPSVPGLEMDDATTRSALLLHGTPTERGSFDFSIEAGHSVDSNGCSTMPDPHRFHLDVTDASDAGADANDY